MFKRIFKNSTYLLAAQAFVKIVAFLYTIFLARNLSVEDFGLYTVALSYFSLISAVADFGISRYLIREIAKNERHAPNILAGVLLLRLSSISVVFAFFAIAISLYDPMKMRAGLTLLAVMAVIPQAAALTFDSVFVAVQKLSLSAFGLSLLSIFSTIIGIILIQSGFGAWGAVGGLVIGQLLYALSLLVIILKQKINFLVHPPENLFKEIVLGSLPYGILGILGLLYFKIDSIMLSYMKGSYETGIYGAAYRFLEALVFIPSAVSAAMFPVLTKLHEADRTQVKKLYFKSMGLLGIAALVLFVGYIFILPYVIEILLPGYTESIPVLFILSFAIPFMFLHVPGAMVLLSTDKFLKPVILMSIFTLSFNIVLNYLLIPTFGYLAAAVVTVLSEIITFIIFFTFLQIRVFRK